MFTRWRNLAALAIVAAGFGVWNASNAALNASFWRIPKMIASGAEKIGCEAEKVGSPRLVVYPALELQYDVVFAGGSGRSMATIPASVALERRPKIEFPAMRADCGVIVQARYLQEYGAPLGDIAGLFGSIAQTTVTSAVQVAALPMSATAVWTKPSELLATEQSAPLADAPMKATRLVKGERANQQVQEQIARPKKQAVLQAAKKKPPAKVRKAQAVKAKPVNRKVKKPLRTLRPSSVRTPPSRQLLSQSERRDYSGSGSSSSGSGSDDDDDDSGSDNSGSGSNNSGSGSSNSGSGSGGDDD